MNPGRYKYPVTFYTVTPVDDFGGQAVVEEMHSRGWAAISRKGTSAGEEAQVAVNLVTVEARMPWTPEEPPLGSVMVWNGHKYNVTSVDSTDCMEIVIIATMGVRPQ